MAAALSRTSAARKQVSKTFLTNLGLEENSNAPFSPGGRFLKNSFNRRMTIFLTFYSGKFQTRTKIENAVSCVPMSCHSASTINLWPALLQESTVNTGNSRIRRREQGLLTSQPSPTPATRTPPATSWRKELSGGQKDQTYLPHEFHEESSCELLNTDVRHPHTPLSPHFIIARNYKAALCRRGSAGPTGTKPSSPSLPTFV